MPGGSVRDAGEVVGRRGRDRAVGSAVAGSASSAPSPAVKHARIATPRLRTLDWTPVRLAVITAILASVALIAAPGGIADGDPASDVLVESRLFNPIDSASRWRRRRGSRRCLNASARAGFPIRVALIAARTDLGTVTPLWRDPGNYAALSRHRALAQLYGGQVLVVMPSGFGLHGPAHGPHAVTPAEAAVRATAPGAGPAAGDGRALGRAAAGALPPATRSRPPRWPPPTAPRRWGRKAVGDRFLPQRR